MECTGFPPASKYGRGSNKSLSEKDQYFIKDIIVDMG
jgi:hypothetical protein